MLISEKENAMLQYNIQYVIHVYAYTYYTCNINVEKKRINFLMEIDNAELSLHFFSVVKKTSSKRKAKESENSLGFIHYFSFFRSYFQTTEK